MHINRAVPAVLFALSLSSLVGACSRDSDTADRKALEQQALQKDVDLALQPDTTAQPQLRDVPLTDTAAPPAPVPAPAPEAPPQPAPRATPPPPRPHRELPQRTQPEASAPAPAAPSQPAGPQYVTRRAPAGSTFSVRIDQELSTRTMREGDDFTATLAEAITDGEGNTVIPAGATVHGRVVNVAASNRAGQNSNIGVAFSSISYGGERYPIDGTVVSSPAVRRVSRETRGQQAAKVGGGAVAGAVLGRILGHSTKSTIAGAVVGAAAGTAASIATADVDAIIPAGSTATVRIDSPIAVRKRTDE
ncbi:MAG TPA: hypothetical protein VFE05_20440 [Longimicrobiaceae bacterium]|jgi:hypothetical protein|nr:hypothetical protein [Longimicrobiaceae bacterium]